MEEIPREGPNGHVPTMRKACQISLMFQVEDDETALAVKKAIDACLPDVQNKRYTFQISEM